MEYSQLVFNFNKFLPCTPTHELSKRPCLTLSFMLCKSPSSPLGKILRKLQISVAEAVVTVVAVIKRIMHKYNICTYIHVYMVSYLSVCQACEKINVSVLTNVCLCVHTFFCSQEHDVVVSFSYVYTGVKILAVVAAHRKATQVRDTPFLFV